MLHKHILKLSCILLTLQNVSCDIRVEGLVNEVINVSILDIPSSLSPVSSDHCIPSVPYITINNFQQKQKGDYDFQITSSIIGIFNIECSHQDHDWRENIEVVVGRVKVQENLVTNIAMSVGLGFALLIMGMEIEIDKVLQV